MRLAPRTTTTVLAAVALTCGATQTATLTAAAGERPAWCATTGVLNAADLPAVVEPVAGCDLTGREIRHGAVGVLVPDAGLRVIAASTPAPGGEHATLDVAHEEDGSVVVTREDESTARAIPAVPGDPCATTAYEIFGFRATANPVWRYNGAGAPAKVAATAAASLVAGANDMASGRNSCGATANPAIAHQYAGTTASTPDMTPTTCTTLDTDNVIGWGTLSTALATTCVWTHLEPGLDRMGGADVMFSVDTKWTTTTLPCVNAYDLESVAAHEWGHVFGLNHVPEALKTSTQTMSETIDLPCDDSQRTLGTGDLAGMVHLYGT